MLIKVKLFYEKMRSELKRNKKKGFTLVECVVGIVVMGIVVTAFMAIYLTGVNVYTKAQVQTKVDDALYSDIQVNNVSNVSRAPVYWEIGALDGSLNSVGETIHLSINFNAEDSFVSSSVPVPSISFGSIQLGESPLVNTGWISKTHVLMYKNPDIGEVYSMFPDTSSIFFRMGRQS